MDIICEVVRDGLFKIKIRNPIRILDTAIEGRSSLGYTVYSAFTDNENITINKLNIISMTEMKPIHLDFYRSALKMLQIMVVPDMDKEIGRFSVEIDGVIRNNVNMNEYIKKPEPSDVEVIPNIKKRELN